jgi:hypothetical protein
MLRKRKKRAGRVRANEGDFPPELCKSARAELCEWLRQNEKNDLTLVYFENKLKKFFKFN